ncbi:phage tail assembly chaperone [Pseudomonas sp. NMI795_08]|nr:MULTISPECIES: phage tail assembly chaperone [Pseudomonas]MCE1113768.1 phage tail assembly chaperone [Pseudomonas sp. NMI795_08]
MSAIQLFYCLPSGQFYGSWLGDPETDHNELAERGYTEVPSAPESTRFYWDAERKSFYLPPSADEEREWRDEQLPIYGALRDRHRDELELGRPTTLAGGQYAELLAFLQALRDWPQSELFPSREHRPVPPPWISEEVVQAV